MSSSSHWPEVTESSPVVEAFVRSATSAPVSQKASRSGHEEDAVRLGEAGVGGELVERC